MVINPWYFWKPEQFSISILHSLIVSIQAMQMELSSITLLISDLQHFPITHKRPIPFICEVNASYMHK